MLFRQNKNNTVGYKIYCKKNKNEKKFGDASFVKEDSLNLKVTKLVQELKMNFKNDLMLFS